MAIISILMTTYNSAGLLQRCLESIYAQTHRPLELIIVDNASTDGTREILAKFESQAKIIYNDAKQLKTRRHNLHREIGFYR